MVGVVVVVARVTPVRMVGVVVVVELELVVVNELLLEVVVEVGWVEVLLLEVEVG